MSAAGILRRPITIAVGNIIPHMYAGWAGGAKMVQPGVTSAVTTGRTHLIAGPRVYEILGNVDNEVRKEMETIAMQVGPQVHRERGARCSRSGGGIVAGDVVKAHRAGVEIARPIYTLESCREARHRRRQLASGRSRSVAGLQAGEQLRHAGKGWRNADSHDSRAGGDCARPHVARRLWHNAWR